MDKTSPDYISQEAFLLTELRYTLGQLRAQLGDLSPSDRSKRVGDQTIDEILEEMNQDEHRFQGEYARFLSVPRPHPTADPASLEDRFESSRNDTIELLESAGGNWQPNLLREVQSQVHNDRQHATAIASCHIELRR